MPLHRRGATRWARVLVGCLLFGSACVAASSSTAPDRSPFVGEYGKLPLVFEENRGQTNARALFLSRGPGFQVFLAADSALLRLQGAEHDVAARLRFVGANADARVEGEAALASRSNYFLGAQRITDVPHYTRVRYTKLYAGIDLVYYGSEGRLEYDLMLAPGADVTQVRLSFDGVDDIQIDASGAVVLRTDTGDLAQQPPVVYQEIDGARRSVDARYVALGKAEFGVVLGPYDAARPLVIDPVLTYSTFLGGGSGDYGTAIAVDAGGSAYIAGYTTSINFPVASAYSTKLARSATNVFVSKLNSAGTALVYSTYLGGGSEVDVATGIAVDGAGNAYVTGTTTGAGFPTTTGAYQKGSAGGGSFVTKLGAAGNTLAYSSYLLKASAAGVAVDTQGSAYVAGSAATGFATTAGAFQTFSRSASGSNAFVLKLNSAGSAPLYSTFVGGSGVDAAKGIAVDASGSAYIGGSTNSGDFPLAYPFQAALATAPDGFVAKLNPAGSALVYSTYLGGEGTDAVNAIAVDGAGSAYVTGETYSRSFPTLYSSFQPLQTGTLVLGTRQGTAFVTKLTPAGDGVVYSTFLGGSVCGSSFCTMHQTETPGDAAYGIAVDALGHAYVTGIARSPTFPLVDPISATTFDPLSGKDALFLTKLSQGGNGLLYSTFVRMGAATAGNTLAGAPYDAGKGVALDASGNAYGVGEGAAGFPTTAGAYQMVSAGATDAVAFKLTQPNGSVGLTISPSVPVRFQTITLTATVPGGGSSGTVDFTIYNAGAYSTNSVPLVNGVATRTAVPQAGLSFMGATYRNGGVNVADSPLLTVPVLQPAVCN